MAEAVKPGSTGVPTNSIVLDPLALENARLGMVLIVGSIGFSSIVALSSSFSQLEKNPINPINANSINIFLFIVIKF